MAGILGWESEDMGSSLCSVSEYPGNPSLYLSLFICQIEIHSLFIRYKSVSDTNVWVGALVDSAVVKRTRKGPALREPALWWGKSDDKYGQT